jgi:hypothetical protein
MLAPECIGLRKPTYRLKTRVSSSVVTVLLWQKKHMVIASSNPLYHCTDNVGAETYKPILKEVEKILAEAGLDEEEMRQRAAGGVRVEQNRNRR